MSPERAQALEAELRQKAEDHRFDATTREDEDQAWWLGRAYEADKAADLVRDAAREG